MYYAMSDMNSSAIINQSYKFLVLQTICWMSRLGYGSAEYLGFTSTREPITGKQYRAAGTAQDAADVLCQ